MPHREYSVSVGSDADTETDGIMSPEHAVRLWGRTNTKSGRSSCLSSRANSNLTLTDTEHENTENGRTWSSFTFLYWSVKLLWSLFLCGFLVSEIGRSSYFVEHVTKQLQGCFARYSQRILPPLLVWLCKFCSEILEYKEICIFSISVEVFVHTRTSLLKVFHIGLETNPLKIWPLEKRQLFVFEPLQKSVPFIVEISSSFSSSVQTVNLWVCVDFLVWQVLCEISARKWDAI